MWREESEVLWCTIHAEDSGLLKAEVIGIPFNDLVEKVISSLLEM